MPERFAKYRYSPGQLGMVRLIWMLVGVILAEMTLFPLLFLAS